MIVFETLFLFCPLKKVFARRNLKYGLLRFLLKKLHSNGFRRRFIALFDRRVIY